MNPEEEDDCIQRMDDDELVDEIFGYYIGTTVIALKRDVEEEPIAMPGFDEKKVLLIWSNLFYKPKNLHRKCSI